MVFPKSTGQILVNDLPPIGGENRGKEEKFKKVSTFFGEFQIDLAQDLRITARNQFSELANFVKTFFGQNSGAIAKTKEFIDAAGIERTNKLLVQARAPRVLDRSVHKLVVRPAEFINATAHAGKAPPYKVGTRVYEFTTDKEIKDHFVRVYSHNRAAGYWIVEKGAIRGKTSGEIKDLLSLPVEPTHIVDVVIPPGVAIRKGIVNPMFDSTGNRFSIQYEIAMERRSVADDKLFESFFQNPRSL